MIERGTSVDWAAFRTFLRRHKLALIIGAILLLILSHADRDGADTHSTDPAIDFGTRAWNDDQQGEDRVQRDRIDGIREVERCMDEDGRIYEAPLGTCT